jgi:hypothetical protein
MSLVMQARNPMTSVRPERSAAGAKSKDSRESPSTSLRYAQDERGFP